MRLKSHCKENLLLEFMNTAAKQELNPSMLLLQNSVSKSKAVGSK